jgi:hypothetical protein
MRRALTLARIAWGFERTKRRPTRAGFDLADTQERVEHLEHIFDPCDARRSSRAGLIERGVLSLDVFQTAQDPRQRLTQIMRDVRADPSVGHQKLFNLVEQAIEGLRERREIVVDRRYRNATAEVPRCDQPQSCRSGPQWQAQTLCGLRPR